jgi:hypothetical protein
MRTRKYEIDWRGFRTRNGRSLGDNWGRIGWGIWLAALVAAIAATVVTR